jgi:PPOX class probable F420-dependent enzyme
MPASSAVQARARFEQAPVARLATVAADGRPHLVPVVFAVVGDVIVTAVDHKPKTTVRLRRLANIAANPRVALLVDEYADDWSQLWWARADGTARTADEPGEKLRTALAARYRQYADQPPAGPYILVTVDRWSGWSATGGETR